jgi:hypothetical protein
MPVFSDLIKKRLPVVIIISGGREQFLALFFSLIIIDGPRTGRQPLRALLMSICMDARIPGYISKKLKTGDLLNPGRNF